MNCRICKKKIKKISFKKIPLVNSFTVNKKFYPNGFAYCSSCDIGFNTKFVNDKILYNRSYLYNGSFNPSKIKIFSKIIKKKSNILEIGGGDGFLGKLLTGNKNNISYLNIDPSPQKSFKTKKIFIEKFNIKNKKKFDIVICLNVLAHVANPNKILEKIEKISHKKTKFIFSVQNSLGEIKKGFLDNVYHEHKYYYSPYSFSKFLEKFYTKNKYYYKINLHGESILFTNFKITSKNIGFFNINKKYFSNISLNKIQKKYFSKLNKLISILINVKNKKIILIGCAPRSIKLLYDLPAKIIKKIKYIYEPIKSKKINHLLPKINIRIKKEKINESDFYVWMPYHFKAPNIFKKITYALK